MEHKSVFDKRTNTDILSGVKWKFTNDSRYERSTVVELKEIRNNGTVEIYGPNTYMSEILMVDLIHMNDFAESYAGFNHFYCSRALHLRNTSGQSLTHPIFIECKTSIILGNIFGCCGMIHLVANKIRQQSYSNGYDGMTAECDEFTISSACTDHPFTELLNDKMNIKCNTLKIRSGALKKSELLKFFDVHSKEDLFEVFNIHPTIYNVEFDHLKISNHKIF